MKKLLFLLPFLLLAGCWQESQCQEMVKDKLSAPSTAIFSKMETYKSEWLWDVIGGFVESQNWFGAMVWTKFFCWMDEKDVFFEDEAEYEDFKKMLKSTTETLSTINKQDKKACEEVAKKIIWDAVKFIDFIWDEQNRSGSRVNWMIVERIWDFESVVCEVDVETGKVKTMQVWDKKYKVSEQ